MKINSFGLCSGSVELKDNVLARILVFRQNRSCLAFGMTSYPISEQNSFIKGTTRLIASLQFFDWVHSSQTDGLREYNFMGQGRQKNAVIGMCQHVCIITAFVILNILHFSLNQIELKEKTIKIDAGT